MLTGPEHSMAWAIRTPLWLALTALLLALLVLAMATHDLRDAAFSTSGKHDLVANRVGSFGAWVSDGLLFVFGFSAWWLPLLALRGWLRSLAGLLRHDVAPVEARIEVAARREHLVEAGRGRHVAVHRDAVAVGPLRRSDVDARAAAERDRGRGVAGRAAEDEHARPLVLDEDDLVPVFAEGLVQKGGECFVRCHNENQRAFQHLPPLITEIAATYIPYRAWAAAA